MKRWLSFWGGLGGESRELSPAFAQSFEHRGRAILFGIALLVANPCYAQDDQRPQALPTDNKTMSDAKSDCEVLRNSVLPFAEQMLSRYGEFYPFGAAMQPDDAIVSIAGYDGQEHPPSADVIRLLKEGFVAGARKSQYKATALIYDIRVTLPSTGEKSDAIAVSLNHRDNYSVIVMFPYKIEDGKPLLGVAFTQKGEADIFPSKYEAEH
jgi:hypothetical protein